MGDSGRVTGASVTAFTRAVARTFFVGAVGALGCFVSGALKSAASALRTVSTISVV